MAATSPPGDPDEEHDMSVTTWTHPLDTKGRRWTRVEEPAAATAMPIHPPRIG